MFKNFSFKKRVAFILEMLRRHTNYPKLENAQRYDFNSQMCTCYIGNDIPSWMSKWCECYMMGNRHAYEFYSIQENMIRI